MILTDKTKSVDIIFYANISPMKRGSFEDFMLLLAEEAAIQKVNILFVFLQGEIELFKNSGMNYLTLTKEEFNSKKHIENLVKKTKAKCLHLNFTGMADNLILNLKRKRLSAVIYTDHSSSRLNHSNVNMILLIKKIRRCFYINHIDKIIAVSNFVTSNIKKNNFLNSKKVTTIYNGIDLERFTPAENDSQKSDLKINLLGVDKNSTVIVYAGQFIEEKGIRILVKAIPFLLELHHDLYFVFVGQGPLYEETLNSIPPEMRPRTRFLGLRDDLENILRASDIMVVPSVWEEAFGLVAAEASACGVPVVASNTGGLPEVVLDGQTGILTPPGDVQALVDALNQLIYDSDLRGKMGECGRRHAEKNFDIHLQVHRFISIYKDLAVN